MNASIPVEVPEDVEQEIAALFGRMDEMMAQIRRDREEGEQIMQQSRQIAQSNARSLAELGEMIARL